MTLCLSKCSLAAVMLRLWPREVNHYKWVPCFGLMILSGLWGIGSLLSITVACDPSTILTLQNKIQCPNQVCKQNHLSDD